MIRRVDAKSSGPSVHFVVTVAGPWDEAIDQIEQHLFVRAKAGNLPALEYEVVEGSGEADPGPGYVQVFPA